MEIQAASTEAPAASTVPTAELSPENRTSQAKVIKQPLTITEPTEKIVWPRFLSRLREAFSLDTQPVEEEQDLINMQTVYLLNCPVAADI